MCASEEQSKDLHHPRAQHGEGCIDRAGRSSQRILMNAAILCSFFRSLYPQKWAAKQLPGAVVKDTAVAGNARSV